MSRGVVYCKVCGTPVPVAPRGAGPESHPECRTLSNDLARVFRAADAALTGAGATKRHQLRRWMLGEIFTWINETFRAETSRPGPRPPVERLRKIVGGLKRTQAGRVALAEMTRELMAEMDL